MKNTACVALAAIATLTIGLAGCGGSPTDKLAFSPPKGWTATPAIFGAQVWIKQHQDDNKGDKKDTEIVLLLKVPQNAKTKTDDPFGPGDLGDNKYVRGANVKSVSTVHICGNHSARLFQARDTDAQSKDSATEMLFTTWGADRYLALYSRPHGVAPDPQAEAAIRSVCAKA
ncbi:MAG: hypothetical protein GIW95_11445 [Candidatus Eremiobacteraeota bacterium]|nr:hypothetical protein [Candidatus Eremiobacteraeota bacterium]